MESNPFHSLAEAADQIGTVQCVKCISCGKLHEVGNERYVVMTGELVVPSKDKRRIKSVRFIHNGQTAVVLCRGSSGEGDCILKFMGMGRDDRY